MTSSCRILIADQDAIASASLAETLSRQGYDCEKAQSIEQARTRLERIAAPYSDPFGVLIVDQDLDGVSGGLKLIRQIKDEKPQLVPIVISAFRKIESAVHAMRCGATDYLLKPLIESELIDAVERAVQRHLLLADHPQTQDPADDRDANESTNHESSFSVSDGHDEGWTPMTLADAMKEPERRILLSALKANNWNRGETARQLDINRTTLYKKIRQYRLDEPA